METNGKFDHMTTEDLREALYDCDDERNALRKRTRQRELTDREKEEMVAMDAWAQQAHAEIMRRAGLVLVDGVWKPSK